MHLAVDQAPIGPRWFESIRTHPLERCRVVIVSAKNRKQLRRFRSAANGGAGRSPRACLAQLAERRLDKAEAPGSNPGASTNHRESSRVARHRTFNPAQSGFKSPGSHQLFARVAELADAPVSEAGVLWDM